jgi:hypothetical protein
MSAMITRPTALRRQAQPAVARGSGAAAALRRPVRAPAAAWAPFGASAPRHYSHSVIARAASGPEGEAADPVAELRSIQELDGLIDMLMAAGSQQQVGPQDNL